MRQEDKYESFSQYQRVHGDHRHGHSASCHNLFYGGQIQPRQIEALFYMAADMQHGGAGF